MIGVLSLFVTSLSATPGTKARELCHELLLEDVSITSITSVISIIFIIFQNSK